MHMERPLKILLVSPEYPPHIPGGLGTHVFELATGLRRRGAQVFVFAHQPGRDITVVEDGITICSGTLPRQKPSDENFTLEEVDELNAILAAKARRLFANQAAPDIVHCHGWMAFPASYELHKAFDIPLVTTVHMLEGPYAPLWGMRTVPRIVELEAEMCTKANLVIAVSDSIRRTTIETYGIHESRTRVIYNSFQRTPRTHGAKLDAAAGEFRKRFIPAGHHVVIFAGRIVAMKGVVELLRSAELVIRKLDRVTFLIVGRGGMDPYSRELIRIVEDNPELERRVKFLGWRSREELDILFRISDIATLPSIVEPFSYVALEAMAAGVPVVATDAGGISEVIAATGGGLLVPLHTYPDGRRHANIEKLAAAQIELLTNRDLRLELSDRARAMSSVAFSFDQMIDSTLCEYRLLARVAANNDPINC
jgi:alpha-maltose-1-phosphate synthase